MQRLLYFLLIILSGTGLRAQIHHQAIADRAMQTDSVVSWLAQYAAWGPKPIGSSAIDSARHWIASKYTEMGYTVAYDTFTEAGKQCYNIVVEKPGKQSNAWVVVGAHYDSVEDSPGANDNGTGTVALLHIAKNVQTSTTDFGLRMIHFSAEETGFDGSKHYVNNVLPATDSVVVMFNLDQLGGTLNADNSKIICETDHDDNPSTNNAKSLEYTNTLALVVAGYTDLTPVLGSAFSSDYVPFEDAGLTITGLYQHSNYPHYHSSTDILANVDTVASKKVVQATIAASLVFAGMEELVGVKEVVRQQITLYPNPAHTHFSALQKSGKKATIHLVDAMGQTVLEARITGREVVDIERLPSGIYTVFILEDGSELIRVSKLIIAPTF